MKYDDFSWRNVKAFLSREMAEKFCIKAQEKVDELYLKLMDAKNVRSDKNKGASYEIIRKSQEEYERQEEAIYKLNDIDPEADYDEQSSYSIDEIEFEGLLDSKDFHI